MSLNRNGPRLIEGSSLRSSELLQQGVRLPLVEILVVVEPDLHAWAAAAGREALHTPQREAAVRRGLTVAHAELLLQVLEQPVGAHQRARERHADLKVMSAHGPHVEHGV